ncbi:carboxypeptidase M32 [Pseudooceanicola sp. CBS1P-1]|uniref:Metal-dependent carboxypeptidase n=1 Tax=Pseudooceanicola albus TaxID=2692189 RepID=A0A6L7FYJ2_9RHOB|nr:MULTISPECIES: carboxypeptidase M32 [Pseudooceanicola]MBT9383281.1 carboxypeptidase M32 [Pseudooceanicola endophyticus]MXN16396.1 carboxypeptidase M32 [Pseudooceanicola albus]
MQALNDLLAFQKDTEALAQVSGRLSWDQETMMPRGAGHQRGEETAALESVLHARRTDPRLGDWLAACEGQEMSQADAAKLRLIRRSYERSVKIPERLAVELARVTSLAQGQWAEAREKDDFAAFAPVLSRVIALRQEEGAALAGEGTPYDALIADYEPGTTAAELGAIFDAMRPRLVDLRARVLEKPAPKGAEGSFDEAAQMALTREIALAFGYDLNRGRIDKAVHPFSSGSGDDVRITTRTNPEDPFNSLYSTIHETGHACYEQNIDRSYALSPLGQGVSMGVHESQSRIYENQLGRSRAFTGWLFDRFRRAYGDFGIDTPEAFYAAVNRVQKDFIRTEADELQYNLHIMLRFDLEQQLIGGTLQVGDLEEAWNTRFAADFGYAVPKPSLGCLQDVHWSLGLFGYFPTYALGNVYAGCLHEALRADLPDLDASLAQGITTPATDWLRDNLQRHGGLREPRDTITHACGKAPDAEPLLRYIETKFSEIYYL